MKFMPSSDLFPGVNPGMLSAISTLARQTARSCGDESTLQEHHAQTDCEAGDQAAADGGEGVHTGGPAFRPLGHASSECRERDAYDDQRQYRRQMLGADTASRAEPSRAEPSRAGAGAGVRGARGGGGVAGPGIAVAS
ncbi:hypothetical protein [Streptomyces formicae]|uniref:Uncharacterized protein n=1 Tax=Streptomyces formicae TaxID=1616117 RepID=A0ABY3WZ33_9ACTN|nr:hypothetical protein [Streptomyces formicae]UNM16920.1 hypothetical protein J4032_24605 [Streptomyces formicae]